MFKVEIEDSGTRRWVALARPSRPSLLTMPSICRFSGNDQYCEFESNIQADLFARWRQDMQPHNKYRVVPF